MLRTAFLAATAGWLVSLGSGCAHLIETRAIKGFMTALEKQDLQELKAATTDDFEQKALRMNEAVQDLEILNLPTGEVSIAHIENASENEKRVTVTMEDSGRRLLYTLKREPGRDSWAVDDVHVKQSQNGVTAAKSVTEQMDLLLSVREFLSGWSDDGREVALSVTTDELRSVLDDLPPAHLARLTRRVTDGISSGSEFRPRAEMDDEAAVVRLAGDAGDIVLSYRLENETWKVADVAVEAREDGQHISSVLKRAKVIRAATDFLTAYRQANRSELRRLCTEKLFRNALAHADLTTVELPPGDVPGEGHEIHVEGQRAEFVLPTETEVVNVSLKESGEHRAESGEPDPALQIVSSGTRASALSSPPGGESDFRVEDVTIYELHGDQEKRLSAVFTAQAVMRIFSEALAAGHLDMLRQTSTPNFRKRVWNDLDPKWLSQMPLGPLASQAGRVVNTVFQGPVTEVTVLHGQEPVTYVLRDQDGKVRVDDVLFSADGRPDSLKTTWELVLSAFKLAHGIRTQQIGLLQRASSDDFNRLIWKQLKHVPDVAFMVPKHLQAPLTSIEQGEDTTVVVFGDNRFGAKVLLVREYEHWVVDEVLLIAGPDPAHRARLKQSIRKQLAHGELRF